MITQWYDIPAEVTEWEISLGAPPDGDNPQFLVFVDDPMADNANEDDGFTLEAGVRFGEDGIELRDGRPVNEGQPWRAQYVGGEVQPHATGVAARVRKREGRPLRIFVGFISRILPRDPCDRCRALVKLAIRAARAATGTLGPDDVIDMADDVGFEVPQGIADFLDRAFGDGGIWDRIKEIARRIGKAFRWLDTLARKICEELGYCAPTGAVRP